jgi:hypothetical protein
MKLNSRSSKHPRVCSISVSDDGKWLIVFEDGSFTTSGFKMDLKLQNALDTDSELLQFTFAPAGGWILIRRDGSFAFERLPSGLVAAITGKRIQFVSISHIGGYYVRFINGDSKYESIPRVS